MIKVFLGASTHYWVVLHKYVNMVTLKFMNDTRWGSNIGATRSVTLTSGTIHNKLTK
jgi:hypothetical protein